MPAEHEMRMNLALTLQRLHQLRTNKAEAHPIRVVIPGHLVCIELNIIGGVSRDVVIDTHDIRRCMLRGLLWHCDNWDTQLDDIAQAKMHIDVQAAKDCVNHAESGTVADLGLIVHAISMVADHGKSIRIGVLHGGCYFCPRLFDHPASVGQLNGFWPFHNDVKSVISKKAASSLGSGDKSAATDKPATQASRYVFIITLETKELSMAGCEGQASVDAKPSICPHQWRRRRGCALNSPYAAWADANVLHIWEVDCKTFTMQVSSVSLSNGIDPDNTTEGGITKATVAKVTPDVTVRNCFAPAGVHCGFPISKPVAALGTARQRAVGPLRLAADLVPSS
jgi:hypothetical protein